MTPTRGNPRSWNRYPYVAMNNPLNIDPDPGHAFLHSRRDPAAVSLLNAYRDSEKAPLTGTNVIKSVALTPFTKYAGTPCVV